MDLEVFGSQDREFIDTLSRIIEDLRYTELYMSQEDSFELKMVKLEQPRTLISLPEIIFYAQIQEFEEHLEKKIADWYSKIYNKGILFIEIKQKDILDGEERGAFSVGFIKKSI